MSAVIDALGGLEKAREAAYAAREERFIKKAIEEARKFKVPTMGRDQVCFMWKTDCEVEIECHLDYEPFERMTLEYPGCPEDVTLTAAYLRGVDIYELLSEKQIDQIETGALIEISENRYGGRDY